MELCTDVISGAVVSFWIPMSVFSTGWFKNNVFFRLFYTRPTCTWFIFFRRLLRFLSAHYLIKCHLANHHISYNREADVNFCLYLPVDYFWALFTKSKDHYLRWNSFLYYTAVYKKEDGGYIKSSFCAVMDIVLSTFYKEGNECTDLEKNFISIAVYTFETIIGHLEPVAYLL